MDIVQTNGRVFRFNGTTWTDMNFALATGVTVDEVTSLRLFNDRLYIGTRVDVDGTKYNRIYYFDGQNFVDDFSAPGTDGYSGIEDLEVHNNSLYGANGSLVGEVYERIGDNDWATLGSGAIEPGSPARTLASYNGSLYAGTGASGDQAEVWRWTGSNWELAKNLTSDFGLVQNGVLSLKTLNGNLYVGLAGPGKPSPIFAYDGSNWSISLSILDCEYSKLAVVGPDLWAATCPGQVYHLQNGAWSAYGNTGQAGVLDLIQFGPYVYAGGFSEGGIYRTTAAIGGYAFSGFFQPVDNPRTLNVMKAGAAVPVKFSLGGNQSLSIFATGYPASQIVSCDSVAPLDNIETTVTAGSSSLTYDASTGQYTYVWKTDKTWANTCRQLVLKLSDGTSHAANFKFK
jgi:hypothetical protein